MLYVFRSHDHRKILRTMMGHYMFAVMHLLFGLLCARSLSSLISQRSFSFIRSFSLVSADAFIDMFFGSPESHTSLATVATCMS